MFNAVQLVGTQPFRTLPHVTQIAEDETVPVVNNNNNNNNASRGTSQPPTRDRVAKKGQELIFKPADDLLQSSLMMFESLIPVEVRIKEIPMFARVFNSPVSMQKMSYLQDPLQATRKFIHIKASLTTPELFITANYIYAIIKQLGQGAESRVYLALRVGEHNFRPRLVVIKASISSFSPQRNLIESAGITTQFLDHIHETYRPNNMKSQHLAIVEPSECDLRHVDFKNFDCPASFIIPRLLHFGLCLFDLHAANLIHRDIKADNLLINQNKPSKITDTGLLRKAPEHFERNQTCCTVFYAGPFIWESLQDQWFRLGHQGKEADIFALGRTFQYDVIRQIIKALGEKHKVDLRHLYRAMDPIKHPLSSKGDPLLVHDEFSELEKKYSDQVVILNLIATSAYSWTASEAFIFPNREQLRKLSKECLNLLQNVAPAEELILLEGLIDLTYELQGTDPALLPTIAEVVQKLEALSQSVTQPVHCLAVPRDHSNSPSHLRALEFAFLRKYYLRPNVQESPFKSRQGEPSFSILEIGNEDRLDPLALNPTKRKLFEGNDHYLNAPDPFFDGDSESL